MLSEADRQDLRKKVKGAAAKGDGRGVLEGVRQLMAQSAKAGADTLFCAPLLMAVGEALEAQAGARRLKMFLVRSVTVEPVLPSMTVEAALAGYVLAVELGGYGSYADELLNPQSALARAQPDLVAVVLDLEDIAGRLPEICADGLGKDVEQEIEESVGRMGQMLRGFRAGNSARLLLQGVVVPDWSSLGDVGDGNLAGSLPYAVKQLNKRLMEMCVEISDCVFFDVDQIAARHGRARWQDRRMFLASRLQVSGGAFAVYSRSLVRSFSALFRAPRKVLCTDLDNTLWGGVLGEDGPRGIVSGSAFPGNCFLGYQQYLKRIAARGVLLAAVSKNNPHDVEEAFAMRSADLALRLDDFVATKIGWGEKTDSLRELAQELSLGLDSFVFVDDNPLECEAVRRMLPEIAVIEVPVDAPWKLVEMLAGESFFDAAAVTDDDVNRSQEYKAQAQRAALSESTASRDELLASLEMVCTFVPAVDAPLARTVQLLAKTNQFNLTTRRHTGDAVERFAFHAGGQAVAIRVRDRFGDAGVVGLALAQTEGEVCRIDSLLLSCRVIGRGVETALLAEVAQQAVRDGALWLEGEYIATRKNAPCSDFYLQHGFTPDATRHDAESGCMFYMLDLIATMPETPAWLSLEGKSNEFIPSSVLTA